MTENTKQQDFIDHLSELRSKLLKSVIPSLINVFFVLFECLVLGESRKFLVSGLKVSRFQVRY